MEVSSADAVNVHSCPPCIRGILVQHINLTIAQVTEPDILPDHDIFGRDILGFTVGDFAIYDRRVQWCWYSEHDIGSGEFIAKICLDRDRIGNLCGTEFVDSGNYAQRKLHV